MSGADLSAHRHSTCNTMDHGTTQQESTEGLEKVCFELREGEAAGPTNIETMWAEPLENSLYRLRNVPFYVYGFSAEDVVSTVEKEGRLTVTGMASRGGHSTYRIFLPEGKTHEEFLKHWQVLERLGCTYERASRRCVGIDVPPQSDVYAVYQALEDGEKNQLWEFEEGHCGHPLHDR
jgi:hypothetical protein